MIKKGVSLLMALALCLTLLPASALAAEAQGQAGQEQTVLTQGNDGQTQAPGQDGAGEDDKTSDEAPDKAPDEEPDEAVSAVQALIDALPAAEDISDANADEVSGQLDAIDEAKQALTEEQAARLDLTGYDAAAAAVLALAGEPDANESALLAAIAGTQPGGSGTAEDPYRITGAAELIWLRDAVNAGEANTCAKLQQDVEYVDEVWTPIGTSEHPYTGTFNGNGHTIRVWLDDWGQALFGYVGANAKLTDIAVTKRQSKNYSISASAPLARINNGTITRCRYSGGITAKDSLGGLVYTNSGTIEACCVYAGRLDGGSRIEMYYSGWAGGIAYENTGTIVNSYFYGDIVQAQSNGTVRDIIGWGAIAYKNSGTVSNCYYGADRDDGYGGKTEDQFSGGEVAYLLNGGTARDDWRQNCYAGDNSDATPVLDRSHAQVRKTGSSYVSLYPHVHCICGGDATSGGHPQHSAVTYTAWTNDEAASQYGDSGYTAANSLPKDPGYYYLTTSVTLSDSDTWRPADGTVLCLNGRTVKEFAFYKPDFDAITVDSGVTFSLTECASIQGYIYCAGSRGVHTVNNSGTFNMYNGRLRDTTSTADGAAVCNNGTFNMYGGTISNNGTSARGGGVYNAGVCNLYGGLITNNGSGGGVYNNGTLTVGGTATVTGGSPNVYLAAGTTITLNSELDESARIGITAEKQGSLADTAAITVVEGGAASLVCFFPDDDGTYDLSFNDDDDVLLHRIRDHTHCACGHKGKYARSIGDHTEHMDREFVAWTDELVKEQYGSGTTYKAADTLPKAAGYYYLTSDVDLGAYPWAPKDGTILCLNGHKITGSWSTAVRIDSDAHIVLTDCRASGSIRNTNTSGAALKSSGSSISRNGIADIFRISLSGTSVGVENYTSNTVNLYNSTVSGTRSAIYNTGTVNIAGTVKAASDAVDSGRYCVNNLGTLTVDGTLTADGGNIGVANRVEDSRSGTITVNGTLICTVDLSSLIAEGGTAVLGSVTDDAGVLNGTCSISEGILRFGFADDASKVGRTAKVKVNVTGADNYEDYTITVTLTVEAKLTPSPEGALTLSPAEITYGEKLGAIAISGTMQADGRTVAGTFTWQEPDTVLDAGTHAGAAWKFMPDDTKTYVEATGTVTVQVNRAAQSAAVSMAGFTYNDVPSAPSLTYQVGDGRAVYYYGTENTASGGTKWENVQPTTLDAGTYYMYAVIGETDNYKEFTTAAVQFVVEKATPDYTKPSGLTAKYGQRLGDIQLVNPEGNLAGTWSWQAPETALEQLGDQSFDADFRPDSDNYKGVVDAAIDVTVGPADGRNLRTVELVQKYTDTEEHTYAPDWSALPEGQRWTFSSEASEVLPRQDFAADGSLLTYAIPEGKALGDQITITLKASCANYEDFTITLHILLREKDDQAALRVTGGTTVVYGETLQLGSSGGSGTGKAAYAVTNGTGEAVIDPDTGLLTPVKVGIVTVTVTKAEDKDYKEAVSDAVIVTITKARPAGQPNYTKIITRGKTLDDAALTLDGSTISLADGVLEWVDDAGNVLPGSTRVKANTAYKWRFTPADGNYTTLSGEIELYYKPNGGNQYGTDHTIRASAGANGTISPAGWTSVGEGGEQTFTITPDAGYAVAKVLVDGRSVGAVTSYTFRNVTQDHTIEAVFMKANGNPQTGVTVTRSTTGCGR